MRVIVCLMVIMFGCFSSISAQGGPKNVTTYNFAQHKGKTIKHIASSPNGKFVFIMFTDGTSIRVSATTTLKVQKFGN